MKKLILALAGLLSASLIQAQNTFPTLTSGGVGIGTTTPSHGYLHINGTGTESGINFWTQSGESTSRIWIDAPNKLFHLGRAGDATKGLTINNGGKLGIGTTSIEAKLEVAHAGTIGAKWAPNLSYFKVTDGTNTLIFDPNEIYSNQTLAIGNAYNQPIYFRNVDSNGVTDLMTIKENGKVGIGTTNPQHGNLEIFGTGASEGITLWTNSGEITSRIWIDTPNKFLHISRGSDPTKGITLDNFGNVSIGGVQHGSHMLAIEGSVGSRQVVVQPTGGWADFVFDDDYTLAPLEDVARFVSENHHLPEIPSESEINAEGINLGEMDAKLLQKIEELTLYLIEQNEVLKAANEKIDVLQKEVQLLKGK